MTHSEHRSACIRRPLAILIALSCAFLATAPTAAAKDDRAAELEKRLAKSDRPDADVKRDKGRKPAEVIAFLGIADGARVIDLVAASGYYTEVLSVAVGPEGHIYAQNPAFVLQFRDGANDKAMTRRLAKNRLPNVERLDREMADLGIPAGSVDAALTALNFHDVYNGRGAEAAVAFLDAVALYLEPGGVLGVIDHAGRPGLDNAELHRMTEKQAHRVIEQSTLVLEAESDVLRHPADDRYKNVFDPSVRGKTDRFVYLLRKPAAKATKSE